MGKKKKEEVLREEQPMIMIDELEKQIGQPILLVEWPQKTAGRPTRRMIYQKSQKE